MHYGTLVVMSERPTDLEEAVANAMECGRDSQWDWYQIGGRWTGTFSGYDPETDPANIGPDGKTKWPTDWVRHTGDIVPVESLTQEQVNGHFAHIVCDGHGWFAGSRYEPWQEEPASRFPKVALPPLEWIKKEYAGGVAVVVDCHN